MQTYTGSCHCGAVRFEVDAHLEGVVACNCSMCGRRGWLLTFVPQSAFRLLTNESATTDYQFNKHLIHHRFCRTCGVASYADGQDPSGTRMVAINVRCLAGVDVATLRVQAFDGKSL